MIGKLGGSRDVRRNRFLIEPIRSTADRVGHLLGNDGYRDMKQLIYRSQPFGFDHSMLAGILMQARRNNRRDDITGALICRQDLYIQLIEGPELAIDRVYAKIAVDNRHCDVSLLVSGTVSQRMFPEWEMLDDVVPSLTWSPGETADGAIEAATPDALRGIFKQIAVNARNALSGV